MITTNAAQRWPHLDQATSLPALFRTVAAQRADAQAIRDNGRTMSYAELDAASDRLAARLAADGVCAGDLVGLLLERSADIPVGILAVMKAGAAYVPLDPAYPTERLRYVVTDASIKTVVAHPVQAASCGLSGVRVVDPASKADESYQTPVLDIDGSEPAYVIYTSGSTGNPKGCVVTHDNVLALLRNALPLFAVSSEDRCALFHSFSFDVSVWEFWASMAAGATAVVVPLPVAQDATAFLELLAEERVTVLGQVPSVFRALALAHQEGGRPGLALRYLVFAGESVDLADISSFLKEYQGTPPTAVNMYGPTETTVYATHKVLSQADFDGPVRSPIGVGLAHLTLEIRDERLEPLVNGQIGELLIAGPGVAVGYLGRPELTAQRFVTLDGPAGPQRYYRTGDLARKLPDGSIEYLGRNDQQIKLRGFRIEVGEVEAAQRRQGFVKDAAVTVVTTAAGAQFLVACVVLTDDAPEKPIKLLRQHAMNILPRYMVPDRYCIVTELPRSGSGKLDRRAVEALAISRPGTHPGGFVHRD